MAAVADTEPPLAPVPVRVTHAVHLLWASLVVGASATLVSISRMEQGGAGVAVFLAVMVGFCALLTVKIRRGRNWARLVYLALEVISLLAYMGNGFDVMELATSAVADALIITALYLLFSQPASGWFRGDMPSVPQIRTG